MKVMKTYESFMNDKKMYEYKELSTSVGQTIKDDIRQILDDYFTNARIMEFLPEEYDENVDCGIFPDKVIVKLGSQDAVLDYTGEVFEHEFESPVSQSKRKYLVSLTLDETPEEAKRRKEKNLIQKGTCEVVFNIKLTLQDEETRNNLRNKKSDDTEDIESSEFVEDNQRPINFAHNAFLSDTPEERKRNKAAFDARAKVIFDEIKKKRLEKELNK